MMSSKLVYLCNDVFPPTLLPTYFIMVLLAAFVFVLLAAFVLLAYCLYHKFTPM
jgi:hypothetical protein